MAVRSHAALVPLLGAFVCIAFIDVRAQVPQIQTPNFFESYMRGRQAAQDERARQLDNQRREEELRALKMENDRRAAELRKQQAGSGAATQVPTQTMPPEAQRFLEAIKYRRYRWPDFDQVAFAPDVQVTSDMVGLMADSRYAADIAYYLGKHKDKSAEIARMALPDAAKAIYAIEAQVAVTAP